VSSLLLLFKRLPFVMMFKPITRQIKTWKESIFVGWFGPVGMQLAPRPPQVPPGRPMLTKHYLSSSSFLLSFLLFLFLGVAGLFYSLLAFEELQDEKYFNIVSFIIFFSVLVHGTPLYPLVLIIIINIYN